MYLTLVAGAGGAVLAMVLGLYVPLCSRFLGWYARWTWRAISTVRPLAVAPQLQPLARGFGMVAVAGWRVCGGVYIAVLFIVVVPVLLFFGTFILAAATIEPR